MSVASIQRGAAANVAHVVLNVIRTFRAERAISVAKWKVGRAFPSRFPFNLRAPRVNSIHVEDNVSHVGTRARFP
jgi:hypothetical protein